MRDNDGAGCGPVTLPEHRVDGAGSLTVVEPIFRPDASAMHAHLSHLFGGHSDGWVELAWTTDEPTPDGRYPLRFAEWFRVTDQDALIARAIEVNSRPMVNVYIGAGLRHPDSLPSGRSHDSDAWKLPCVYVDLDDPGSVKSAREVWTFMKPTFIVGTGREPHLRGQAYWKLEEPITDHAAWQSILRALARTLGGDPSVSNPGRVLRLAGSVAWPQKPGRKTEMTFVAPTRGEPPPRASYNVKTLAGYFQYNPQIDGEQTSTVPIDDTVTRSTNSLGLADKITDGREKYMTRMLFAAFISWCGQNGAEPTVDELVDETWPVYERKVDLTRPGRGKDEMRAKAQYLLRRFASGGLRGLPDLDAVIDAYKSKKVEAAAEYAADEFGVDGGQQQGPQPSRLRSVDFTTLYNENAVEEPDYIEDGFAGPGNFVLIAGPPKAQKSFLLQELLVSCALGRPFLCDTFNVPRPLRVYYLQAEMNRKLLRKRAKAMKGLTDADLGKLSTNLITSERFQMLLDESGVAAVVAEIKAVYGDSPPDIIAIDPFANVYDGESENDNAQIMRFLVTRVERVRQAVNPAAAIVMVHHATKAKAEDMARDPFVLIRGAGALRGYYDSAIVIFRKNEETKTRKVHFELRSGESPEPMEVELHEGVFVKTSALTGVSMETSRAILRAMDQAFRNNEPWNDNKDAARHGRGAFENMVKFGITRDAAAILLKGWVDNDIVKLRERASVGHALKRPAGYEVIGYL